jgi:hypothetical protein
MTKHLRTALSNRPRAIAPLLLLVLVCALPLEAHARRASGLPAEGGVAVQAGEPATEGEWLQKEDGRRYREVRIEKKDLGKFVRLDGKRIRSPWGIEMDYIREEEDAFVVHDYETAFEPADPNPEPTAEQLEEVAASYRFELPASDRLVLEPFDQGLPRSGQWRQGFDVADMNGDGELDIVHGPPRKVAGMPVVILGDGKGGWRPWAEAEYPALPYDYGDAAAADFDGDGRLDVALGNHLRGQIVLLQREPGKFVSHGRGLDFAAPGSRRALPYSSRALETADFDGDGRVDIVALGEGPSLDLEPRAGKTALPGSYGLVLYRNLGAKGWERRSRDNELVDGFGDALVVADLDADGRLDVVQSTHSAGQREILRYGSADGLWEARALDGIRPHTYVRGVVARDLDGDGRRDLAISYVSYQLDRWRSGVDLHFGRGERRFERRALYAEEGSEVIWTLAAGDLDGDGRIDLVGLTGDAGLFVFLGTGDGRFSLEGEEEHLPRSKGCRGYHVRLVDLDRDGSDEIVAAFAGEAAGLLGVVQQPGCPGGGSLRAWKAKSRTAASAPRAQPSSRPGPSS